jgi:hypothetical protein
MALFSSTGMDRAFLLRRLASEVVIRQQATVGGHVDLAVSFVRNGTRWLFTGASGW